MSSAVPAVSQIQPEWMTQRCPCCDHAMMPRFCYVPPQGYISKFVCTNPACGHGRTIDVAGAEPVTKAGLDW